MYQRTIGNLSVVASQLRANFGLFNSEMSAEEVCVRFARRHCDSCLPEETILMLVRMSDDWIDFRSQIEDWESSLPAELAS